MQDCVIYAFVVQRCYNAGLKLLEIFVINRVSIFFNEMINPFTITLRTLRSKRYI